MENKIKNILLTGSNGFVGQEIAKCIAGEGHLIGLGRKAENQCPYVEEYVSADLSREGALDSLKGRKLDVIIHAAANLDMAADDAKVITDNCLGTFYLTRLAVETGCSRFIFISSLPVVGTPKPDETGMITEKNLPHPETVYHASKLMGEHLVSLLNRQGIQSTSLRIPSPVGVGMSAKTILSVFLQCARNGETITLRGKGTRRQNYVDVRDIAQAVLKAIQAPQLSECYDIVARQTVSNTELANLCIRMLDSQSEIRFEGQDSSDDVDWRADGSLAEKELGFVSQYTLEDTIAWMQSEMR